MYFASLTRCFVSSVLIAGAASSCSSYNSTLPALKTKAASDFACGEAQVQNETLSQGLEKAKGCGKENLYAYYWDKEIWLSPLDRAEFDLDCKRGELSTQHLGAKDVGVSGCGKKAVYVLTPTGWVMNSVNNASE